MSADFPVVGALAGVVVLGFLAFVCWYFGPKDGQ